MIESKLETISKSDINTDSSQTCIERRAEYDFKYTWTRINGFCPE